MLMQEMFNTRHIIVVLVLVTSTILTVTSDSKAAISDVVHVERRPLFGSAQIYWPHKHWWGKKKKKRKPKRKVVRVHRIAHQPRHWDNQYDKPLNVHCNTHKGEGLVRVRSRYNHYYFDRQWKFNCHKVSSTSLANCKWTGNINKLKQPFSYMCPKNTIMTGIQSVHHNRPYEDRVWKVRCCAARGHTTKKCRLTGTLNQLRGEFDHRSAFVGKEPQVFVGFQSLGHFNTDRKFQVMECHFAKVKKCPKPTPPPEVTTPPPSTAAPGLYFNDISPYDLHFKFMDYYERA